VTVIVGSNPTPSAFRPGFHFEEAPAGIAGYGDAGHSVDVTVTPESRTAQTRTSGPWPWAFSLGGILFLIGGALHPNDDTSLPEAEQTAESLGAAAWIPAHALLLVGSVGFLIGLVALARSPMSLPTAARRATWVAAVGAALFVVEGVFHLGAFADRDAVLSGEATPLLSTHMAMGLVAYPLFAFAVAALAVLSGHTLTHPVVGVIGAIGAVAFGVAPTLVGAAGIEALVFLFPVGGIILGLWITVAGVMALIRGSARQRASIPIP